jgi:cytochrome d ubiquinol oxidase subunit II
MSFLQPIWFYFSLFILIGYAILDGFDLGVGIWFPFRKINEGQREGGTFFRSIAPFWDGNEVWLLALGGILFAVFPDIYATVLSGFYVPLMLILFCLIFRAVSISLRQEYPSLFWHKITDTGFFVGSLVPSFLYGVIIGNLLWGVPLNETGIYIGGLLNLFNPFAILIGFLALAMFATHGSTYLILKTTGDTAEISKNWMKKVLPIYFGLFALILVVSAIFRPQLMKNYLNTPILLLIPLAGFASMLLIVFFQRKGDELKTFVSSALSIGLILLSVGMLLYPVMVFATNPMYNLTIFNASSPNASLLIMLISAIIGFGAVLIYSSYVYRLFSGKVTKFEDEVENVY